MTDEMRRNVDKLTTSVSLRSFVRLYFVSLCILIDTIKVTIYTRFDVLIVHWVSIDTVRIVHCLHNCIQISSYANNL